VRLGELPSPETEANGHARTAQATMRGNTSRQDRHPHHVTKSPFVAFSKKKGIKGSRDKIGRFTECGICSGGRYRTTEFKACLPVADSRREPPSTANRAECQLPYRG